MPKSNECLICGGSINKGYLCTNCSAEQRDIRLISVWSPWILFLTALILAIIPCAGLIQRARIISDRNSAEKAASIVIPPSPPTTAVPSDNGLSENSSLPPSETTPSPEANAAVNTEWRTYSNSSLGFCMDYPQDWNVSAKQMDPSTVRVLFQSSDPDICVVVDIDSSGPNHTNMNSWMDMDRRFHQAYQTNYQRLSLDPTTLGGMEAVRWSFTLQKRGTSLLKKEDIGASCNGKSYAICFASPPDKYDNRISDFQRMVSSFAFLTY